MISPHVQIHTRGASSHAHDTQVPRLLGPQNACLFQAVTGGVGGINQTDQILKLPCESIQCAAKRIQLCGIPASSHPADADHTSQQAIAGHLLIQGDQRLLQTAGMGVRYYEADIGRDGPNVANMIADPFQLQQDGPHHQSAQRNFNPGRAFDGLTECRAMGKTRISGNALRQKDSFVNGEFLKEFFRALMRVEHSELQIEYWFTRDREIEVARFDDSCMDRSYGHLKHPFTQSRPVDVAFSLEGWQYRFQEK